MKAFKATELEDFLKLEFFVPGAANALSLDAARELRAIQKKFSKIKKPVIVSSVHPRVFCSGGNLSDYKKLKGKAPGLKVNREIASILNAFAAWPVPKLALIDGDVLGGGMEWLARFDFRWASPNAYFVFWQKRIGLSTGWGGGRAWAAKIGEEKMRRLLIESQTLSAGLALREGLIDRVVTGWRLQEEAAAWAAKMNNETTSELLKWKPASEQVIFSKLWMGRAHAATLKSWKT